MTGLLLESELPLLSSPPICSPQSLEHARFVHFVHRSQVVAHGDMGREFVSKVFLLCPLTDLPFLLAFVSFHF